MTQSNNTDTELEELRESIEDWLDNGAQAGRLPVKVNFSDIQKIAELLAPQIERYYRNTKDVEAAVEDKGLDEVINLVKWGDYQKRDGTWGRGVANREELKTALLAWSKQRERAALESLLKELVVYSEDIHPMNDTFVVPVDYIEETIEDQITNLGGGNDG